MSASYISISQDSLTKPDILEDGYTEYVKSFLVRIKFALAYRISKYYNISYRIAMDIVKIHSYSGNRYTIGIDSPSSYPGKYRQIVQLLLEKDIGSVTKKIVGKNIISSFCNSVSSTIQILWLNFIRKKIRGY